MSGGERIAWDGTLRHFDDPKRKPGEPFIWPGSDPGRITREIDAERDRAQKLMDAAVANQAMMNACREERDRLIAAALREHIDVSAFAVTLGLSRQHLYAIAKSQR